MGADEPGEPPELVPSDGGTDVSRRLVLVTGAGRSGTSTIAGTLHYLGLHVPLPVLGANRTNPRGFFESTWPMRFHRKIMERAVIDRFDARPEALELIRNAVTEADRVKLRDWLGEVAREAAQTVVKDPRSSWLPELWAETAAGLGLTTAFLTMLRHPAEVVASHSVYYAKDHDAEWVRRYEVVKLAGWVNANLLVERLTRGQPRVFVRYDDLLDNWRSALAKVRDDLDLTFNDPLNGAPHRVDEFIDPTLHRVRVSWDDLDVPSELRDIATELWSACDRLADSHGVDEPMQKQLDMLSDRYASLYRDAKAIAHDAITSSAKRATRAAQRSLRAKQKTEPTTTTRSRSARLLRGVRAVRRRLKPRR